MTTRIDTGIDSWITKTQYGFRHDRSTSQAIFLARRLLDLSEVDGSNLTLVLLDWEKALDKVDRNEMFIAMERMQVHEKLISLVKTLYKHTTFKVEIEGNWSELQ